MRCTTARPRLAEQRLLGDVARDVVGRRLMFTKATDCRDLQPPSWRRGPEDEAWVSRTAAGNSC